MSRLNLTQQELAVAISMITSGVTLEQIAKMFNIDELILFNALKTAGYCPKC